MKINKFFTLTVFSIVLISCGGEATNENENSELNELIAERDSLKDRLTFINAQIAELDTASRVVNPIVSAQAVVIKKFEHKIEVQGAVETDENAMINAEASGKVTMVHVQEGQKVSMGQALVTIDATILSSQIQEMETQLELATYMYEKQKKLMDEGVGTEIDYEQAKAQKNSLEKSIQTMRSQQGKTIVRAPFSGVVDEVMIHMGEMAAPGVPLLRIVNNKNVKVTASLSENYLSKVYEGTEIQLSVPSLNDTIIYSKISSKGNFIDPVNRTFRIRIDIKNNKLLLPNQLAKVQVTDFEKDSALVINAESILQDTKNNNYIYKLSKTEGDVYNVEKVVVNVLSQYKGEACIETINGGAINDGDQIVVKGAKGITDADQVIIQ
ncbi:MAG: efflux RND transporter periplasmic adaptor subunit [Crocinitomicaceae bacterium]